MLTSSKMPIIAEAEVESERMSDLSNLELSMREFVFQQKPWQRRGIIVFESLYYILIRFALILVTVLIA